ALGISGHGHKFAGCPLYPESGHQSAANMRQVATHFLSTWHLFSDASEHENSRALLRSEGHIAFVNKADRTSGIERVGVENLLILFATRAAGRFTAGPRNDSDRPSAFGGR